MAALRIVLIPVILAVLLIPSLGALSTARAQVPQHIWSQSFGDADEQFCGSVAADGSGNVIVTGDFQGSVDFGGGPLTSAGSYDIVIAKYDGDGYHVWSRRFGDEFSQLCGSVALDGSGNIIVTGHFEGTVDFGGGPLTSVGYYDVFVAKFDGNGNHLWSKRFFDQDAQYDAEVAVDNSGNVIVTGTFETTVDFGGQTLQPVGYTYIVKFNEGGNHVWTRSLVDTGSTEASVAVDGSGDVIMTGYFVDTVDFGGGPLTSAGSNDVFVAKFNGRWGFHIWSQRFGDEFGQVGASVAVDGSGNVIVTGHFEGNVDFGGGPLTSAGAYDNFVAKFDGDGNHVWSQRFGDENEQYRASVAVDGSGNVIVTGRFAGTMDFGGGPLTSVGSYDMFLAKFDGAGSHVWSQRFGNESELPWWNEWSIAVDGSENVIMSGAFQGDMDFGGGLLASAGLHDIFIAKFGSAPSPTLLQSCSATVKETGIVISWRLADAAEDFKFSVFRTDEISTGFRELYHANIVQEDLCFTFVDDSFKPGLTYRYRVDVSDEDGRRTLFETEAITAPSLSLSLNQNYPNPFNPTTTISFVLPERVEVNLSIFNVNGNLIRTLVDEAFSDGFNEVTWDGRDNDGNPVSSGVYLYRLKAGKNVLTKKLMLLK